MDYQVTIQYLFPTSVYSVDYTLYFPVGQTTPVILNWNTTKLGGLPTVTTLQQAWDSVLVQQAQVAQLAVIAAASAAAQTSGFTSSALGSAYTYPSAPADQANLTSCVVASLIAPAGTELLFWCTSPTGVSAFVPHTAAQIQAVGLSAMAAIMATKQKQLTLSEQIAAATTIAAVQAIVW